MQADTQEQAGMQKQSGVLYDGRLDFSMSREDTYHIIIKQIQRVTHRSSTRTTAKSWHRFYIYVGSSGHFENDIFSLFDANGDNYSCRQDNPNSDPSEHYANRRNNLIPMSFLCI